MFLVDKVRKAPKEAILAKSFLNSGDLVGIDIGSGSRFDYSALGGGICTLEGKIFNLK